MPTVRLREGEDPNSALRRFKRACEKAGIIAEIRKREHYEKPTTERKRKKLVAKKKAEKQASRNMTVLKVKRKRYRS